MSILNPAEDDYNSEEDEDYTLPPDAPENVNADLIAAAEAKETKDEKPSKNFDELWEMFNKEEPTTSDATERDDEKKPEKVVTVYDFAGEKVEVETACKSKPSSSAPQKRKGGGLDKLLSAMKKPKKMSVLDKSARDWNSFVQEEDIAEELEQHTKSKDSYVDKQNFLNSVDHNRFQREKADRELNRKPR